MKSNYAVSDNKLLKHSQGKDGTKAGYLPLLCSLCLGLAMIPAASSQEKGDITFRLGVVNFDPDVSSSPVQSSTSGLLAGSSIDFSNDAQLGLNLSYMISNSFAVEAMITAPFEHDLTISGLNRYGLTTTNIGQTKQLPLAISALYYFGQPGSRLRPYLGAGINYTKFFDDSLSTQARLEMGAEGLELDEHFGMSARAGVDWKLDNGWFVNASVWRMNIDSNASFNSTISGPVSTYFEMDPWVYSVTVGHAFDW